MYHMHMSHKMVKVNASYHINKPLLIPKTCSKSATEHLPSSSPVKSSKALVLLCEEATKEITIDYQKISIHVNSSFSSSPIKRICPLFVNKKGDNEKLEISHSDLSLMQTNRSSPQKCTQSLDFLKSMKIGQQNKSYTIDESVSTFLQRFNNDGILDLGLDEISYGADQCVSPNSNYPAIRHHITYCHNKLETIIVIPPSSHLDIGDLKRQIVSRLRCALILSQKGARKYKVVILTPRPGASWFERKLKTSPLPFHRDFQYIIVIARKSFASKVKECMNFFN